MPSEEYTEHKLAEEALRAERDRAEKYLNIVEVIIVVLDARARITLLNRKGHQVLGYKEGELIGKDWIHTCLRPKDHRRVHEINRKINAGELEAFEYYENYVLTKKGEERFIAWHTAILKDENGCIIGTLSSGEDITERKMAEKTLKESEEKYRKLVENSLIGIGISCSNQLTFANPALLHIFGYDNLEEFLKIPLMDHFTPESKELIAAQKIEVIKGWSLTPVSEYTILRKDGQTRVLRTSSSKIVLANQIHTQTAVQDITEQKQAHEALHRAEQEKAAILDGLKNVSVEYLDPNMNLVWLNNAVKKHLNLSDEEILGKRCFEVLQKLESPCPGCTALKALQTSSTQKGELITPDGKVWISSSNLIRDADGKIIGVVHVAVNITERKRAEEALRSSESKLASIIDFLPDATFVVDNEKKVIVWNRAIEEMTGVTKDKMIEKGDHEYTIPFYGERRGHLLDLIDLDDKTLASKYQYVKRKGDVLYAETFTSALYGGKGAYVMATGAPLFDNKGCRIGAIESIRDITEARNATITLKEQYNFLQQLIDSIPNPIFFKDTTGSYLGCNKAFEAFTGHSKDKIIGYTVYDLYPKDLANAHQEADNKLLQDHVVQMYESSMAHADGSVREVMFNKATYFDTKGRPAGIVGVILDITERKHMENALKESERRLADIIDFLPDATLVIDNEGNVIAWNHAIEEMTGIKTQDMLGKGDYEYSLPFYGQRRPILVDLALESPSEIEAEYSDLKWIEGTLVGYAFTPNLRGVGAYLWGAASPIYDIHGKIVGAIESIKDITDRKQTEDRIKVSLNEKEVLLKEIHHRVKNNLQVISALLSLQSSYITDEDIKKIFRDSQNRIKSMALVHENLYRSKDLSEVDFNEYINKLVSNLSQSYGNLARKIKFKVHSKNVYLNINTAIPCGMIINELISNSLKHAFKDGRSGEICIDFSQKDDVFKLIVSDNGVGIKGELNIEESKTLGFRLIDTLVKQIDGTLALDTTKGFRCEIHFKGLK